MDATIKLLLAAMLALLLSGLGSASLTGDEINETINHYGHVYGADNGLYRYRDGMGYNATLDTTNSTEWAIKYNIIAHSHYNINYAKAVFDGAGASYFEWVSHYSNPLENGSISSVELKKTFPAPSNVGDLSSEIMYGQNYQVKLEKTLNIRGLLMDYTLWAMKDLPGL
jgi:hypothetical protein